MAQRLPMPEPAHATIEHASPGAAYRALLADPGVQFREQDGWVIANDPAHRVIWTFSPQGDPAFPALVKRQVIERHGQLMLDTAILCGAGKQACDAFARRFQRLAEDTARAVQQRTSAASAP